MQFDAKVSAYLIELLRSALNETTPCEKPEEVAWESVFRMAKKHSVCALSFYALQKLKHPPEAALLEKWNKQNGKVIAQCVNQETEYSLITASLEAHEIPFMPLKGSVLRELFAYPYLREMSDIDILIPPDKRQEANEIALQMGYFACSDVDHHVSYQKPPYMGLELHTDFFSPKYEYYKYYHDPWVRAYLQKDRFWYGMKNEDLYLYLLAHSAKHYYYSGTGIRSVIDVYVFNRAYRSEMDAAYLAQELKKLNLETFARQIEALAQHWFSPHDGALEADYEQMRELILSASTYGSSELRQPNELRRFVQKGNSVRFAKARMSLNMVFLPRREMKYMFPSLSKTAIHLPICWVIRWLRILFTKPQSIINSYKQVKSIQLDEYKEG